MKKFQEGESSHSGDGAPYSEIQCVWSVTNNFMRLCKVILLKNSALSACLHVAAWPSLHATIISFARPVPKRLWNNSSCVLFFRQQWPVSKPSIPRRFCLIHRFSHEREIFTSEDECLSVSLFVYSLSIPTTRVSRMILSLRLSNWWFQWLFRTVQNLLRARWIPEIWKDSHTSVIRHKLTSGTLSTGSVHTSLIQHHSHIFG